jgi:hypothetical protein
VGRFDVFLERRAHHSRPRATTGIQISHFIMRAHLPSLALDRSATRRLGLERNHYSPEMRAFVI